MLLPEVALAPALKAMALIPAPLTNDTPPTGISLVAG
jgi:hypothetical protein